MANRQNFPHKMSIKPKNFLLRRATLVKQDQLICIMYIAILEHNRYRTKVYVGVLNIEDF